MSWGREVAAQKGDAEADRQGKANAHDGAGRVGVLDLGADLPSLQLSKAPFNSRGVAWRPHTHTSCQNPPTKSRSNSYKTSVSKKDKFTWYLRTAYPLDRFS